MLLRDLANILSGHITIYAPGSLKPIFQNLYCYIPESWLDYEVKVIGASHYYPRHGDDESIDCIDIDLIKKPT